jgi:hypothetical protein
MGPGIRGLLLALGIVASAGTARAETCPVIEGGEPALAQIDSAQRVRFLRDTLHDQARRARTWSVAWAITGSTLAEASFTLAAFTKEPEQRVDSIVGGASSLLIPALLLLRPLAVLDDERTVDEGGDGCLGLRHVEEVFVRDAANEAAGVSWRAHALALGFNVARSLVLGLALHHWKGALTNGVGGIVVSETQILTQPTGAVTALRRYREGALGAPSAAAASWFVAPAIAPGRAGITGGVAF